MFSSTRRLTNPFFIQTYIYQSIQKIKKKIAFSREFFRYSSVYKLMVCTLRFLLRSRLPLLSSLFRKVEIRPTTHEEYAGAARNIDRPRAILDNTHAHTDARRSGQGWNQVGWKEIPVRKWLAVLHAIVQQSSPRSGSHRIHWGKINSEINKIEKIKQWPMKLRKAKSACPLTMNDFNRFDLLEESNLPDAE